MQYKSTFKIPKNSYFDILIRIIGLIFIFQISRIVFYVYNKSFFGDIDSNELISIIEGGFLFDLVSIIYLNLLWILIYILPYSNFIKNKLVKFSNQFFFFINALALLFNAIDAVYYQFNLKRTTYSSLFEIGDLPNFWTLIPSFIFRYWQAWASWFLILLLLWFLLKITSKPKFTSKFRTQIDFFIILLFPILAGVRGGNLRHSTRPIGINNAALFVKYQSNAALVLNTPFTIFKTLGNKSLSRLRYFKDMVSLNQQYNPVTNFINTKKNNIEKYNIVVLIIESYSEEASGLSNKDHNSGGFTPFLDTLRLQSFYSDDSFANGKKSIEALPALLCGIPSLKIPFVLSEYSSNRLNI